MILEFGVYTGGSIRKLANLYPKEKVYGFDWFHGLREDWAKYQAGDLDLEGVTPVNLPRNVELVIGVIEETLPSFLQKHPGPVKLVHIDTDVYSTAKFILNQLVTRFVPGSVVIFDEYWNFEHYEHYEWKAFNEFRSAWPDLNFVPYEPPFQLGVNAEESAAFRVK